MVIGNRTVRVPVKRHEAIYKVPNLFIVSMEDVGSILMNVYAFHLFAIDITTQLWALVYNQTLFSLFRGIVCKRGTI